MFSAFCKDLSGVHSTRFLSSDEDICTEEEKVVDPRETAVPDWVVDRDESPFGG